MELEFNLQLFGGRGSGLGKAAANWKRQKEPPKYADTEAGMQQMQMDMLGMSFFAADDYLTANTYEYTTDTGFLMNEYLRGNANPASLMSAFLEEHIERTDSAMRASLQDLKLVRGVTYETVEHIFGRSPDKLYAARAEFKGMIYSDKGYTSTSYGGKISKHFHDLDGATIKINAPKGTQLVVPKSEHSNENEILLARGTSFKVKKITRAKDGQLVISVDVIK